MPWHVSRDQRTTYRRTSGGLGDGTHTVRLDRRTVPLSVKSSSQALI